MLKRIVKFHKVQKTYMPGLRNHLEQCPEIDLFQSFTSTPELIPLHLPSSFPSETRLSLCSSEIVSIEDRLRFSQAHDSLSDLRRQLRSRVIAYKHKARNIASQREFMRSRDLENGVELRVTRARLEYVNARSCLFALRGPGEWEEELRELRPEDVRGLNERALNEEEKAEYRRTRLLAGLPEDPPEDEDLDNIPTVRVDPVLQLGEGRRTLSWLWYSVSESELNGTGVHDSELVLFISYKY
jgi:hypothetical protein